MSTEPYHRHPLGLPPGSVRAILALGIAIQFWIYLFSTTTHIPLFVFFLLALVPPFFAAHGTTISPNAATGTMANPLYLPKGTFRFLIFLGTIALVVYQYYVSPEDLLRKISPAADKLHEWPYLLLSLLGGLTLGFVIGKGPWRGSPYFQDIQAWLSLLALLAFVVELLIDFVIRPAADPLGDRLVWHAILVGILAFYFSSRS